jgi:hypothetical protein
MLFNIQPSTGCKLHMLGTPIGSTTTFTRPVRLTHNAPASRRCRIQAARACTAAALRAQRRTYSKIYATAVCVLASKHAVWAEAASDDSMPAHCLSRCSAAMDVRQHHPSALHSTVSSACSQPQKNHAGHPAAKLLGTAYSVLSVHSATASEQQRWHRHPCSS